MPLITFNTFNISKHTSEICSISIVPFECQDPIIDPTIKAKDVSWLSYDAAVATVLIASLEREASERGEPTAEGFCEVTLFHCQSE